MDRFVESGRTRGSTQPRIANGGNATDRKKKMTEEKERTAAAAVGRKPADTHSQPASLKKEGESIDKIVQAVAHIPLIKVAVAEAMQESADKIREELHIQDTRMGELEERLLTAEEEIQQQRNTMQHMESALHIQGICG